MKFLTSRVVRISCASLLAGVLIGLVGGAFRYCLIAADSGRSALIAWAHAWPRMLEQEAIAEKGSAGRAATAFGR